MKYERHDMTFDKWQVGSLHFVYVNFLENRTIFTQKMAENVNIDLSGEINATTEKKGLQKYVNEMEL